MKAKQNKINKSKTKKNNSHHIMNSCKESIPLHRSKSHSRVVKHCNLKFREIVNFICSKNAFKVVIIAVKLAGCSYYYLTLLRDIGLKKMYLGVWIRNNREPYLLSVVFIMQYAMGVFLPASKLNKNCCHKIK